VNALIFHTAAISRFKQRPVENIFIRGEGAMYREISRCEIVGFLWNFSIVRRIKLLQLKLRHFGNWFFFRPYVKGERREEQLLS
jgi:hypothetical protein